MSLLFCLKRTITKNNSRATPLIEQGDFMEKCIENLNDQGYIAYQMKCINSLIDHFSYDYEEWREILEYISDCTFLVNTFNKVRGIRAESDRMWDMYCCHYQPSEVLAPFGIPQKGTNRFFHPCRECSRKMPQYADRGATYGLCMNILDCKYVREKHNDPYFKKRSPEEKRNYKLYLKTDLALLRVLEDIFSRPTDLAYDYFDEGWIVLLWDTLKVLDELKIPHPDCDDIHEYAFGEENNTKRFSTVNLIRKAGKAENL